MIITIIVPAFLPLRALPASVKNDPAIWMNETAVSSPEMMAAVFAEIKGRRQQPIPTTPFPLRNVVRGAENLTWLNRGTLDNPPSWVFRPGPRQYPPAFFPLDNMYTAISPTRYAIEIRDKDFRLKDRLENTATGLSWEWNRVGGCGRCTFVIAGNYLRITVAADDDIRIYMTNTNGTSSTLVYRGYVESVTPTIGTGNNGDIRVECAGYFKWCSRIIVQNSGSPKSYSSQEISLIVQDLVNTFLIGNAPITLGTVDQSTFVPDSLDFKVSLQDALSTLFDLIGDVEYGVDANLQFYWRAQSNTVSDKFWLGGNITRIEDRIDFKDIANKLYLEGGDVGGSTFTPSPITAQDSIDRYGLHEEIISNGAVTTNSVANQLMAAILIKRGKPTRQMSISLKNTTKRFETSIPMGAIVVVDPAVQQSRYLWGKTASGGSNKIWGLMANSGSGLVYGGARKEQIDRIRYSFSPEDGRLDAEVQFGNSIASSRASATLKRIEQTQDAIRQRGL